MKPEVYWHLGLMLSAYENIPEFHDALLEKSRKLVAFLQANELAASDRLKASRGDNVDFVIDRSDLTFEGSRLFVEDHVGRWLAANDNIDKPITTKRLETGLKRIRK
jgi:hypothetical protein